MKIFKQNKDMSFIDITNKVIIQKILLFSIAILYFFSSFRNEVKIIEKKIVIRDTVVTEEKIEDIPLTDSAILCELIRQKCVLPNVALAQAKIESSHFKSNIAKENKNIFGIRNSSSIFAKGLNRGHTVYQSYRDCISDYIRVQDKYLKNIHLKYAENPNYTQKIKSLK